MIQRIQTLWLLLVIALAALSFKFSFYVGTWIDHSTAQHLQEPLNAYHPSAFIMVATAVIVVLALIGIFMYKSRKQQMTFTVINLLLSLGLIYLYYAEITNHYLPGSGTMALTSVFVFAIPIVLIMAIKGIRRDIKLLKSADRLRN